MSSLQSRLFTLSLPPVIFEATRVYTIYALCFRNPSDEKSNLLSVLSLCLMAVIPTFSSISYALRPMHTCWSKASQLQQLCQHLLQVRRWCCWWGRRTSGPSYHGLLFPIASPCWCRPWSVIINALFWFAGWWVTHHEHLTGLPSAQWQYVGWWGVSGYNGSQQAAREVSSALALFICVMCVYICVCACCSVHELWMYSMRTTKSYHRMP